MGLLDDLDRRRERVAQDNENSARLAEAYGRFRSVGIGSFHFERRVGFDLTFTEKPFMSYGAHVDIEELQDLIRRAGGQDDMDTVMLPLCSGYVVEWDQDERDFYTGAWVAARVWFPQEAQIIEGPPVWNVPENLKVEVEHMFTFAAIGMKDIPPDNTDATE